MPTLVRRLRGSFARTPLVAAVLAAVGAAPVAAQAARDTVHLPAMVVTATGLASPRGEVANAVTVLTGEDLARRGIVRVADALREVPGVSVVQSGSPGAVTSLFMRGGESDYVRVLIDGVPANEPGGAIDLANLSTADVDRIEIVRGPVSALFGSDAVAGVIQIFTRRGAGRPAGSVAALGGGAGSSLSGDVRGGSPSGVWSYSAGASRLEEAGAFALNNRYLGWSAAGSLRATPDAATDIALNVRHTDGVYHYPTDYTGNPTDSNQYTTGRLTAASLAMGRALTRGAEVRLLLGATAGTDLAVNPPDSAADVSAYWSRTDYARRDADVRANFRPAPHTVVTIGAAGDHERFWSSSDSLTRVRNDGAFYAQVLAPAGPRISLTAGARVEDNDRFGGYATERAGLVARLGPATSLRLSAGTAFKEPTFLELYGGGFAVGNPHLEPERSRSAEVGIERALAGGRARASATLFTQRFASIIEYTFTPGPDSTNYRNLAAATARGVELEAHARAWRGGDLSVEWTWLHTAARDSGVDGATYAPGQPLLRRPAHSGSVALDTRLGGRASAGVRVLGVGSRQDLDFDPVTFAPERVALPAYVRVDLSGAVALRRASGGAPGLDLVARVQNAFDRRYEEVLHFPARGRTVWLGVRSGWE